MTNKTIGIIAGILILAGIGYVTFSSNTATDTSEDDEFSITTSFYPLAFALEEIVGDAGTVTNIGEGRDPHDYRPSVQDVVALENSDLVVLQGADFETWGDDIKEQLEREGVPVVIATNGLELREGGHDHDHKDEHGHDKHEDDEHHDDEAHGHDEEEHHDDESHEGDDHDNEEEKEGYAEDEHDHDHGAFDPHTWVDPILFSEMVQNLTAEVIALDPANADTYQANADTLIARLAILDQVYSDTLVNCTLDEVITSHDAFGYLGERYDFTIHSIAGLSTQDLPSSVILAELREEAEEGVGAILLEANSISAYGETLARETGLLTLPINPASYVIPEGQDYFSIMEQNLATLRTALECNG